MSLSSCSTLLPCFRAAADRTGESGFVQTAEPEVPFLPARHIVLRLGFASRAPGDRCANQSDSAQLTVAASASPPHVHIGSGMNPACPYQPGLPHQQRTPML